MQTIPSQEWTKLEGYPGWVYSGAPDDSWVRVSTNGKIVTFGGRMIYTLVEVDTTRSTKRG